MLMIGIRRFPLHQNTMVFAIMMFLMSLIMLLPMFLIFLLAPNEDGMQGMGWMLLIFPFFYLVMGYVMVVIGCAFYNFVCKFTGGLQYEAGSDPIAGG